MIPKIIHYCWLSGDAIPEKLAECMKTWKQRLPDYEFKLWDRSRFDVNSVCWVKEAFENKKYAFAADYIRLYALYTEGGIYLDMDVEVIKPFNDLLDREYILGYEKEKGIEAGIMGASPNANWVKKCLDFYENRHFINKDGSFNTRPLPRIIYSVLKEDLNAMEIFSNEFLTAKSYYTGEYNITPNTYTIHHFAGSWLSPVEVLSFELRQRISFLPEKAKGHIAKLWAIKKINGVRTAIHDELRWLKNNLKTSLKIRK